MYGAQLGEGAPGEARSSAGGAGSDRILPECLRAHSSETGALAEVERGQRLIHRRDLPETIRGAHDAQRATGEPLWAWNRPGIGFPRPFVWHCERDGPRLRSGDRADIEPRRSPVRVIPRGGAEELLTAPIPNGGQIGGLGP